MPWRRSDPTSGSAPCPPPGADEQVQWDDRIEPLRTPVVQGAMSVRFSLVVLFACHHHAPPSQTVSAPEPPRHCAAWFEVDVDRSVCGQNGTPLEATPTTVPAIRPSRINCTLRCDQPRPGWEVDLQVAGFRGSVLCEVEGGPRLRLSVLGDKPSSTLHARWTEVSPVHENLAVGGWSSVHSVRMPGGPPPCASLTPPGQ